MAGNATPKELLIDHFMNAMPVQVDRDYAEHLLDETIANEKRLSDSERFDYQWLKKREIDGIELYDKFRNTEPNSPERLTAWINQLSPWNLQTGADATSDLIANEKRELLHRLILLREQQEIVVGQTKTVPLRPIFHTKQFVPLSAIQAERAALKGVKL